MMDESRTQFIQDMIKTLEGALEFGEKFEALKQTKPNGDTMKTHSSPWQNFDMMCADGKLFHDRDYFIRWTNRDGKTYLPRVATWDKEEGCFFDYNDMKSWPLIAHEVMEIPK
mgnify:CR=1 FL=1